MMLHHTLSGPKCTCDMNKYSLSVHHVVLYLSGELREAPGGGGFLEDLLGGEPGRESAAGGQHGDGDQVGGTFNAGLRFTFTRKAVAAWSVTLPSCFAKRRSKQ